MAPGVVLTFQPIERSREIEGPQWLGAIGGPQWSEGEKWGP